MARGKAPTTGRYDTREELCADVWSRYLNTPSKQSDIARACRVSAGVVQKILDTREGHPAISRNDNAGKP